MPTGIALTNVRRNQLLEELLRQQGRGPKNPQTGLEAALRIGAEAIRAKTSKGLQEQEVQHQKELANAIDPFQRFEQIESGPPAISPQAKPESIMAQQIAGLDPQQQVDAATILQGRKELADPSPFQQKTTLQEQVDTAAGERQAASIEATTASQQSDRIFRSEQRGLDRNLSRELAQDERLFRSAMTKYEADRANGTAKPLTDSQGKTTVFSVRAEDADDIITKIGGTQTNLLDRVWPLTPNGLKTTERQKFEQAQRNFINATLRVESGAVISDAEFDNAREQYIPQPGDGPEVLKQKAQNRKTAVEGFKVQSGPGYQQLRDRIPRQGGAPDTPAPPQFNEGDTATDTNGVQIVFRNGEWVSV